MKIVTCFAGLMLSLIMTGPALAEEAATIDELVAMFDESRCIECHADIHAQWRDSWHAKAVESSIGSLKNFITVGLAKEWEKPMTKAELLKCLDCHAPVVNYATEALAVEIGNMIVTAAEAGDSSEGAAAKAELARLNVGCLSCHFIKAKSVAPGLRGKPEEGVIYGPNGEDGDDYHESVRLVDLTRSAFCMQCHGIYQAPDGETIQCNTISGSYRDAYVANGGGRTCQDCHMEKGHLFPGGHDLETVQAGLGLDVQTSAYQHLPGQIEGVKDPAKWVPSVILTASIANRTGHRVPDG